MERVTLEALRRAGLGKNQVRRLRHDGQVPGIVYGRGREPLPVAVNAKALGAALHTQAGRNVLIDLAIGDGDRRAETVMVKDLQRDIFRRDITHVDFYAIDLTRTVEAHVPITFVGQPAGIADGGVFEVHLREVVVKCLPTQIPEHIEVNINALGVGDAIHVRDVLLPPEVTAVSPPEEVVATVVVPKVVEEVTPAAAAAAPEVGAAVAAPEAGAEAKPAEAKPGAPEKPEKADKAKQDAGAKAKPDAGAKVRPDAGAKAKSDAGPKPKSDAGAKAKSDKGSKAE
jgi:large subunit ribosomal protein L25